MKKNTPSGIRFKEGSKKCGLCHADEKVIQFERDSKRKGLPIIEIVFMCESCADKLGLIDHSKPVVFR